MTARAWPRSWTLKTSQHLWFGCTLAITGFFTLAAFLDPDSPVRILVVLFLPAFAAGIAYSYMEIYRPATRQWSPTKRAEKFPDGVSGFPFATTSTALFHVLYAAMVPPLVLAPLVADALPPDDTLYSIRFQNWAPFGPVAALYFAAHAMSPVLRGRWRVGVGLSKDGVYHWSWFGCCFFRWEWITAVRATGRRWGVGRHQIELTIAEPSRRPHNSEENWIARFGFYRKKLRTIPAGFLSVNPASCYYALHYYLRHPEKRDELGTDAALERMRTLDFPDIIAEIKRYGDVRSR